MKKIIIATLLSSFAVCASAAGTNSPAQDYKYGYKMCMDYLKDDPTSNCVNLTGNSYEPSKAEYRGRADAERDFAAMRKKYIATSGCTFGYAVWEATGSHADNWLEGPQRIATMRETARMASFNKHPVVYDQNGAGVSAEQVNRWFVVKKVKGYDQVSLTPEAFKTCSKKQIG
jgi:hypothetical protein